MLIVKQTLVDNCNITENADVSKVNISITQAEMQLKAILCRDYYDWFVNEFNNDTLAGQDLILLNEYIKIYLSWAAYERYILLGSQDNMLSGFREQTSENSQPVTESRLNALRKNAEEQSLFYKNEMLYFLRENIADFPLYEDSDCYSCKKQKYSFKFTGAGK